MTVPILDAQRIRETIATRSERIRERFPNSGLLQICGKMEEIAAQTEQRSWQIARPIWTIKLIVWMLIALLAGIVLSLPFVLASGFRADELTLRSFMEPGDPVLNEIIVIGALVFFYSLHANRVVAQIGT